MARTWLILVLFHCGIVQAADDQQSILNIIMSESESRQGKINSLMEYFEKNEKQKIAEELIYAVNKMETFYGEK